MPTRVMWVDPNAFDSPYWFSLCKRNYTKAWSQKVMVIPLDPASLAALREKMAKDIRHEALVTATEADDAARAALAAIQPRARGK